MKRYIVILAGAAAFAVGMLTGPAHAETMPTPIPSVPKPKDSWSGSDKKLHLGVSYVLGIATGAQWPSNKPLAFAVAMAPGVLKEISDRSTTGFSAKDLTVNAIGVALGITTSHFLVKRDGATTTVAYATQF